MKCFEYYRENYQTLRKLSPFFPGLERQQYDFKTYRTIVQRVKILPIFWQLFRTLIWQFSIIWLDNIQ